MLKCASSLENVLLCVLKSLCSFRQNIVHMFLIHFLKLISMFCKAHLKSMTFGVALSYLSLEQEVTFPMRALDLTLKGKRMNSKLQGACGFQSWLGSASPPLSWKPQSRNTSFTAQNHNLFHLPFPPILCPKFGIGLESNISLPELFLTALKFTARTTEMLF